jgi:hypothetical protein
MGPLSMGATTFVIRDLYVIGYRIFTESLCPMPLTPINGQIRGRQKIRKKKVKTSF